MPTTETDSTLSDTQIAEDATEAKGNYEAVRFNAMKHGILSRLTVLPHEDPHDFGDLLSALVQEHQPAGATEAHLVDELASIIWRKRRVLQAEGANINQGLKSAARNAEGVIPSAAPFEPGLSGIGTDLRDLLMLTPEGVAERQRDASHNLEAIRKAAAILQRGGATAYDNALRTLMPDSRDWWQEYGEDEDYPPTSEGLADFIKEQLEPLCVNIDKKARHHAVIKAQTLGEGLQAHWLEKLNRYETHLDRKFQRTLAMLVKLKELRGGK
jgi:hypothetical protein